MRILVLDSESDGLAYDCTKLHVLSYTRDVDTTMVQEYKGPGS